MTRILLILLLALVPGREGVAQTGSSAGYAPAPMMAVQDIARIQGQNGTVLRGLGIVVGLPGTGDSGAELALARPLAEWYAANGNPLADLSELAKAKSAAIVSVELRVPGAGARVGDTFDVRVSTSFNASSLRGGTLLLTPLLPPGRTNEFGEMEDRVFAMASGPISLDDEEVETNGRVPGGATITADIVAPPIEGAFNLIVDVPYRGWTTTREIASQLNAITNPLDDVLGSQPTQIARALDDMTIRVVVPSQDRVNPANFIADVLSYQFDPALLDLPAQVVVNRSTGQIFVTGDVQVLPGVVTHHNLTVTVTTPPPLPTPADPLVERETWVSIGTAGRATERARVQDLLQAFERLDVNVEDQIELLRMIHRAGRLTGRFVVDG